MKNWLRKNISNRIVFGWRQRPIQRTANKIWSVTKQSAHKSVAAGKWIGQKSWSATKWTGRNSVVASKWTGRKTWSATKWSARKSVAAGKWTARSRMGKFFTEHAIQTGVVVAVVALALFFLFTFKQGQPSDATDITWWALALLLVPLFWIKPSSIKGKWSLSKSLLGVATALVVLVMLGPTLLYGATGIYLWATTEKSAHAVSYSTRSNSVTQASPYSILLTAKPEWSDWHTMPLDSKARFIAEQKGLAIKFRSPSGKEEVVKDDPKQKRNLSELGIMAEAIAFQVQSETGGDLSFTVYYTPKGG